MGSQLCWAAQYAVCTRPCPVRPMTLSSCCGTGENRSGVGFTGRPTSSRNCWANLVGHGFEFHRSAPPCSTVIDGDIDTLASTGRIHFPPPVNRLRPAAAVCHSHLHASWGVRPHAGPIDAPILARRLCKLPVKVQRHRWNTPPPLATRIRRPWEQSFLQEVRCAKLGR